MGGFPRVRGGSAASGQAPGAETPRKQEPRGVPEEVGEPEGSLAVCPPPATCPWADAFQTLGQRGSEERGWAWPPGADCVMGRTSVLSCIHPVPLGLFNLSNLETLFISACPSHWAPPRNLLRSRKPDDRDSEPTLCPGREARVTT